MSSFLSSLYILESSPLSDVGLLKISSHSVDCRFVLLMVSFIFTEPFQLHEVLFIVSHSVCATGVLVRKLSPMPNVVKAVPHFLCYQVQCNWIYVEVFDPHRLEFCAG